MEGVFNRDPAPVIGVRTGLFIKVKEDLTRGI
jgi:hypothetical protein